MLRSTDICPESCWLVRSLETFGGLLDCHKQAIKQSPSGVVGCLKSMKGLEDC